MLPMVFGEVAFLKIQMYLLSTMVYISILLLSNMKLYFRFMGNNPIVFVGEHAFENLPKLTSL